MKHGIVSSVEIARDPTHRLDACLYLGKPYSVHWKRQGEWIVLYRTDNPDAAKDYANNKIVHGGITERIEIRDGAGVLEAVYDSTWEAS